MAKDGEFGSIPDDIFGLWVGLYTAPNPPGTTEIPDSERIKGLAALARAEHAAATATKEPHVVTLTMLCIGVTQQLDFFKAAAAQVDKDAAIVALLALSTKLQGIWK
jgi:hypothetical protein